MPQHDLDIANGSGAAVRGDINGALAALGSTMKGPNAPPAPVAGMMWVEDDNPSSTRWTLRVYDGADWIVVGIIDSAANIFEPASTATGLALIRAADAAAARATLGAVATAGFRNLIVNGNPTINQRGYVSGTATTGANQYTLDRWRVVVSGQSVSWTDSAGARTVTAPAGGMEQVVEGALIAAGTYTLSWTGTAAATINGNAVSNGGQVTLTGGADATVRMSSGTWSRLQLEPGSFATAFEPRPIAAEVALCERYFEVGPANFIGSAYTAGAFVGQQINFRVRKRTTPVIVMGAATENTNLATTSVDQITDLGFRHYGTATAAGNAFLTRPYIASAEF